MFYTMHRGIVVSKFVENNLNYGVGARLGRRSSSLLGTGLTGLGHRSDRLIYVDTMQIHADRSDRSVVPV